jgi:uncharacterized protein YqeY
MPKKNNETLLFELLTAYIDKPLKNPEVRNALVRDILATLAASNASKLGATVMTKEAAAYNPKTDTVPIKPKSL